MHKHTAVSDSNTFTRIIQCQGVFRNTCHVAGKRKINILFIPVKISISCGVSKGLMFPCGKGEIKCISWLVAKPAGTVAAHKTVVGKIVFPHPFHQYEGNFMGIQIGSDQLFNISYIINLAQR